MTTCVLVRRDVFVGFGGAEWQHNAKGFLHMSPRDATLAEVDAKDGIRFHWPDHLFPGA